jgi:hypothetical protein
MEQLVSKKRLIRIHNKPVFLAGDNAGFIIGLAQKLQFEFFVESSFDIPNKKNAFL